MRSYIDLKSKRLQNFLLILRNKGHFFIVLAITLQSILVLLVGFSFFDFTHALVNTKSFFFFRANSL